MNMNNPRNKINGALMKAAGMVSGVSDLTLLHNGKVYFIELKTPKGRMSENQINWELIVTENGFGYYIVKHFEDFRSLVNDIIKNKHEKI